MFVYAGPRHAERRAAQNCSRAENPSAEKKAYCLGTWAILSEIIPNVSESVEIDSNRILPKSRKKYGFSGNYFG
jgi:hypothetical protein